MWNNSEKTDMAGGGGTRWWGTAWGLILPAAAAVGLFILASLSIILPAFENTVMERKREMIRELTQVAINTLSHFEQKAASGEMTVEEAKKQALELLKSYRYGVDLKDYYWINDRRPYIIMHPYRPDLEGRDVSEYADPTGKRLFVEFVRKVKESGEGYVDYMWQWMDSPDKVAPKVSYVKEFKPWGWIVGTGVYIEDVRAEMAAMRSRLIAVSLIILVVIAVLSAYLIGSSVRHQVRRLRAEQNVRESRRRLRLVMDNIPQHIYWKDRTGTYLGCNPAFARLAGLESQEKIKGLTDRDLGLDDASASRRDYGDMTVIRSGGREMHRVEPYPGPDGDTRWLDVSRVTLSDDQGQVVGLLGSMEDITERRRTEEALKESERRFRTLVENSLVGIFILQGGVVQYMNPKQQGLFGDTPDPFVLKDFKDAPGEDLERLARLDENNPPRGGWPLEMELRIFPFGGLAAGQGMRWVHCLANPISHRGAEALLVIMLDITKAKELEHMIIIQDKMASLGRVAAGIAHEIRNPLSGINMYISALKDAFMEDSGVDEVHVRRICGKLEDASRKIEKVVKRVLDFAKPSKPNLTWAQINDIINQVLEFSSVTLRKNGIQADVSLTPKLPSCHVDAQLIEQALMNLVTNAVQALRKSGREKKLQIQSAAEQDWVVIRVSDSGPGIDPDIRMRVFDPFFTIKKDGSGIGLSLSHRIITDHGGTLTVGSNAWGGAEFIIRLPALTRPLYDSVG